MTDLNSLLESSQNFKTSAKQAVDTFYMEIEERLVEVVEAASSESLWDLRDRMEDMRAAAYKLKRATTRNLAEATDIYTDGMRNLMGKSKNTQGLHFEERKAQFEIKNITAYKAVRTLERVNEDLKEFSFYLEGRLRWVKDRQKWLHDREQSSRYNN